MTLLESVVALVIFGLVAIGVLDVLHGAGRSARDMQAWTTAVAYAEEGIEAAKLGAAGARPDADTPPSGFTRRIDVRAWAPHVADVTVTITLPSGAQYVVHRLVAEP